LRGHKADDEFVPIFSLENGIFRSIESTIAYVENKELELTKLLVSAVFHKGQCWDHDVHK